METLFLGRRLAVTYPRRQARPAVDDSVAPQSMAHVFKLVPTPQLNTRTCSTVEKNQSAITLRSGGAAHSTQARVRSIHETSALANHAQIAWLQHEKKYCALPTAALLRCGVIEIHALRPDALGVVPHSRGQERPWQSRALVSEKLMAWPTTNCTCCDNMTCFDARKRRNSMNLLI